jgi:hypothetical protein
MLSVVILNVMMVNVIVVNGIMVNGIMVNGIMVNVILLNVVVRSLRPIDQETLTKGNCSVRLSSFCKKGKKNLHYQQLI